MNGLSREQLLERLNDLYIELEEKQSEYDALQSRYDELEEKFDDFIKEVSCLIYNYTY